MRTPSILFINRVYPPSAGATGRILRDLARGFAAEGWRVTILTTGKDAQTQDGGGITIHRVAATLPRKNATGYLKAFSKLAWAALRLPRHDVIVTMTDPPFLAIAGSWLARRKKSKHIHWCQDVYPDLLPVMGYGFSDGLLAFMARRMRDAMNRCDRVIVIGRCMARALVHRGVDQTLISVIPNWPDEELAEDAEAPVPQTAAKKAETVYNDPVTRKFRVLYAGTLGRAHPVDTVLNAAALLQKTHPDIEFVFVGNGGSYAALADERARRGLDNVKLLPRQPASRLRALMESGDVHLVTMNPDAAGLLVPCKIYAAMAVARPCILVGPDHGEAGRALLEYNAGIVVPQGEAKQLAAAVRRFREDGDTWFACQEGARRAAEVFVPGELIHAWIDRAAGVVGLAPRRRPQPESVAETTAKEKAA